MFLLDDLKTGHDGSFRSAQFHAVATNLVGGGGADGCQVFQFLLHNTVRLGGGYHGRNGQTNGDVVVIRVKGGGQLVPILPVYFPVGIILWQKKIES